MQRWTLAIDRDRLRAAVRRLTANVAVVGAIALLLPFLNATLAEVLWVSALCLGVAVAEAGIHLLVAGAKMAKIVRGSASSFPDPSAAPRSQQGQLR